MVDTETSLDHKCAFCFAHCIDVPPDEDHQQFARAFVGIIRWRNHLTKKGAESLGLDPIEWTRRVLRGEKMPGAT